MEKIKYLQLKKLLKELDYIQSDFEWRNEIVIEADTSFMRDINDFLENNPKIKDIYDKKVTEKLENSIKNKIEENDTKGNGENSGIHESNEGEIKEEAKEDIKNKENTSPKLKRLYREIVKLTHPDKVKKRKLNDLYIDATDYYNNGDRIGIYKVCSELEIEYEIEEEDEILILSKIDTLKGRIGFLESTFTWRWFNCKDEMEKNQIVVDFIKLRIQ